MNTKKMLLSVIAFCTAMMVSAEGNDTCTQMPRTQEMFQKDLERFAEESRNYMLAGDIIPVDSLAALSKEQKKTKKYAEKLLKSQKNKILLPIEFNSLIGDSLTNTPYELGINWDNAYFAKSDNKCANLYIPLKSDKEGVQPLLNVFRDEDGKYYRIVITYKQMQTDSIKEEIVMRSNIDGLFLNAFVLNNEKLVSQINGVVGDYGVMEGKTKALYIRSRIYNRFCTTGYPYEMSYADSYEYLKFNTNPVKKWGRVKTY